MGTPGPGRSQAERGSQDMLLSPWSSLQTARGPAWALLSSVCVRGTVAPVPAPLLHPSPDGGLSCSSPDKTQGRAKLPALRSQRCPHDQELRHGCPALTPVNTVTTQGGYTGQRQSLRTAGVRWDPFHRHLGWQSWGSSPFTNLPSLDASIPFTMAYTWA